MNGGHRARGGPRPADSYTAIIGFDYDGEAIEEVDIQASTPAEARELAAKECLALYGPRARVLRLLRGPQCTVASWR
jgi:hypothetical protein